MLENMKQELINPNLKGYSKCWYCGKYYDTERPHPCFTQKKTQGRGIKGSRTPKKKKSEEIWF